MAKSKKEIGKKFYKTSDMPFAATLHCLGKVLRGIEGESAKKMFVFVEANSIQKL